MGWRVEVGGLETERLRLGSGREMGSRSENMRLGVGVGRVEVVALGLEGLGG